MNIEASLKNSDLQNHEFGKNCISMNPNIGPWSIQQIMIWTIFIALQQTNTAII